MKVGDLISFKPIGFGNEDWSNPCIVLERYEAPNDELWVVWVDGMRCVLHNNEHYDIVYLTGSQRDDILNNMEAINEGR